MGSIFFEITVIVILASLLSIVFRIFRQPVILAYILTGILIGRTHFFPLQDQITLQSMAEVGITLLLFMLGLEIRISELPSIGRVALLSGFFQVTIITSIGYVVSTLLGFSSVASAYIGLSLAFASTIIVVKLLSDRRDLHSLYGKISIGISLFQDFFAIIVLIFLTGLSAHSNTNLVLHIYTLLYKGFILILAVMLVSKYVLSPIIDFIARSSETLFLFSLAWVFGLAAFVSAPIMGFSIEIGGFLAGLALAQTNENFQIAAKMKTLRDFFLILFFVLLGVQMDFGNIYSILLPAIILSIFVLVGNPLIVMSVMGTLGYRKRTSFLSAINLGEISEFSLILVFLGQRLGHISKEIVSLVTLVAIITFTVSTYNILHGNNLYRRLRPYLSIFERKGIKSDEIGIIEDLENHVVLIGAKRVGDAILHSLMEHNEKLLVVDFDPEIIKKLKEKSVQSLFGDIADMDIQEQAQLHKARMVISTVPNLDDNLLLIAYLNSINRKAKIVVLAEDKHEEKMLYKAGADYVVIPHLAGGHHIAKMITENHLERLDGRRSVNMLEFL